MSKKLRFYRKTPGIVIVRANSKPLFAIAVERDLASQGVDLLCESINARSDVATFFGQAYEHKKLMDKTNWRLAPGGTPTVQKTQHVTNIRATYALQGA